MKKIFTLLIIGAVLMTFYSANADKSKDLVKRKDIKPEYKWDLTQIYNSDIDWQKDYIKVDGKVNKIKSLEGTLGKSADNLYNALAFVDELYAEYEKIYQYSSLAKDLDLANTKYQEMNEKAKLLGNKISTALSFFNPEILQISEKKLQGFIKSNKSLELYKHRLDDLTRLKKHTLSTAEERIISLERPVDANFGTTYGLFANADIQFPIVKDENGNDYQLSHARYYAGMSSLNRDFRKRVYKGTYVPFLNLKNTLASLYYGSIKSNIFQAKARNYKTTLEWALDQNNIPVKVYKNLINSVNANLQPLHRWCSLKKKILGYKEMHPYDTYVTLFPNVKREYTFEEAKQIVLKALAPLGKDYISKLKNVFKSRLIDVYETKGKAAGAYSSGSSKLSKPYVLLNWGGELNDVFTLAHELGHNMHSLYTVEFQPLPYADYPIFLAEVASITNEMLLLDYLIEHSTTKDEKLALIEKYLNNMKSTFYRQARFAEFEMIAQSKAENGEALTSENLSKIFGDLYQKYWGKDMVVDMEEAYSWPRIHHFFYDFYVYSYATSFASAQLIAKNIKREGEPAIKRHLDFLKSGESEYAIPTLKKDGVDMTKPDPIVAVAKKMNSLMDEMEKLINSK